MSMMRFRDHFLDLVPTLYWKSYSHCLVFFFIELDVREIDGLAVERKGAVSRLFVVVVCVGGMFFSSGGVYQSFVVCLIWNSGVYIVYPQ